MKLGLPVETAFPTNNVGGYGKDVRPIIKMVLRRHGKAFFSYDANTRYWLIKEEFANLREWVIQHYGSSSNHIKDWLKRKGMRKIEYENELSRARGFKDSYEYRDFLYQRKGFKNVADYWRFKRLRKKHHKSVSDFVVRELQLKKEAAPNVKVELKKFILIRQNMRKQPRLLSEMKQELKNQGSQNPASSAQALDVVQKTRGASEPELTLQTVIVQARHESACSSLKGKKQ